MRRVRLRGYFFYFELKELEVKVHASDSTFRKELRVRGKRGHRFRLQRIILNY